MNRPKLDDYKINNFEVKGTYVFDLEKYCDELEKENKQLKKDYEFQKQQFNDALNKATRELENARNTLIKERNLITKLYKEIEDLVDGK